MKLLILAAALLSPIAAHAASPEDAYIAARDAAIAAFQKTADTKAVDARNKQHDKVQKELERKLKAIVGSFAMRGFPAEGKINLDTLFSEDEGFGMLDGIVYGETEGDRSVVVTTDGLLRKWLEAHGDRTKGQTNPPVDPAAAAQTELFYSQAISTDAAVVSYSDIPLAKPDSAKFVAAKLDKAMAPIAECGEVTKIAQNKADAADKAYAASEPKDEKLADVGSKLRNDGDEAFRRCYGEKVKSLPMFKTASDQARAILDALPAK
jgi:hypothetical protein